ncbi:hypothetical protein [Cellulomonas hominis]
MNAPPDPPAPQSALQPWTAVIVLTVLTIPFALPLAFAGWLWTPAFAGGEPHPGEGTALWAASAGFLVVGFVAAPGPMRVRRLAIGAGVAVVWFVIGRFVLSAP